MQPNLQQIKARLTLLETEMHTRVSDGTFSIYKLTGESELGKPYEYEVTFISSHRLQVENLVDTDVHLFLNDELKRDDKREIYGKIFKAKEESLIADKYVYKIKVVHPLYYLGMTKRYEIFQEMSAMEIIQKIVNGYSGLLDLKFLSPAPPRKKREYTTQYEQSDLEFIQMLCQEEGVTLNLQGDKQDASQFVVKLENINDTYRPFAHNIEAYFNFSKEFRTTHMEEDYYDFKAPSLNYSKKAGKKALSQTLADNPKTSQLRNDLKHYRLRDRVEEPRSNDVLHYSKEDSLQEYAHSEKIYGRTHSLITCDGHAGEIKETESYRKVEVLITKVTYDGFFPNALEEHKEKVEEDAQHQFTANFEALPLSTTYIAPKTIQKPRIYSTVTAIVSGGNHPATPDFNTIDIDKYGRIRVIFHFDPQYPTSCYIRFTNFSAGNGWGAQFIPRVNTEVVVSFLNGDPDRPIAIGSLYNNENQIPENLPANKTKSYIKTQSMPGTPQEFNLLSFEDKGGSELVHMKAQKDHLLHVLHDSDNNIDHDERTVVGNDRTEHVKHDETITVDNNRTETVHNNETITVDNNRTETVHNNETIRIDSNRNESVGANESISIGSNQSINIGSNQSLSVGKNQTETVSMMKAETIGLAKALSVGGAYQISVGAAMNTTVGLSSSEQVGVKKSIIVGDRCEITVGGSSLVMNSDGTIIINCKKLKLVGSDHVEVNGKVIDLN